MEYLILNTNPDGVRTVTFTDKLNGRVSGKVYCLKRNDDLSSKLSAMKVSGTPGDETNPMTTTTEAAPTAEDRSNNRKRALDSISRLADEVDPAYQAELDAQVQELLQRTREQNEQFKRQKMLRRLDAIRTALVDKDSLVFTRTSYDGPLTVVKGVSDDNSTVTILERSSNVTNPKNLVGMWAWSQYAHYSSPGWVRIGNHIHNTDVILMQEHELLVCDSKGKFYHAMLSLGRVRLIELKPIAVAVGAFLPYCVISVSTPRPGFRPVGLL